MLALDSAGGSTVSSEGLSQRHILNRLGPPENVRTFPPTGFAADIWSCGVILYVLQLGEHGLRPV